MASARTLDAEWQVSASTVHRMLERAGERAYYLHDGANGTKRYRREEVDAWLSTCTA